MKLGIKNELPILAIVTSIGYLSAYMFQFGILSIYGIPLEFISVDINSLLFSITLVAFIFIIIVLPFYFIITMIVEDETMRLRGVVFFVVLELILIGIVSFFAMKFSLRIKEAQDSYLYSYFSIYGVGLIYTILLNGLVLFVNKMGRLIPEIRKPLTLMAYLPITIVLPLMCGVNYALINAGSSFYKGTDYFLVLENSKGIIVASCSNKNGMSYKRLGADEASFEKNYSKDIQVNINKCIKKWERVKVKI